MPKFMQELVRMVVAGLAAFNAITVASELALPALQRG